MVRLLRRVHDSKCTFKVPVDDICPPALDELGFSVLDRTGPRYWPGRGGSGARAYHFVIYQQHYGSQ